jgi:hypothetical protein
MTSDLSQKQNEYGEPWVNRASFSVLSLSQPMEILMNERYEDNHIHESTLDVNNGLLKVPTPKNMCASRQQLPLLVEEHSFHYVLGYN